MTERYIVDVGDHDPRDWTPPERPHPSEYADADDEPRTCILSEADILAGRDDDCTTHAHEGDDNPYGYDEEPF